MLKKMSPFLEHQQNNLLLSEPIDLEIILPIMR